jgi:hypothetical protein
MLSMFFTFGGHERCPKSAGTLSTLGRIARYTHALVHKWRWALPCPKTASEITIRRQWFYNVLG